MDLAKAKGESLEEAEQELAMAYDGRLMMMKRLGLASEAEVKSGMPYEQLLQRIETRMGGTAAAAMDTYAGKMQNLKNITEAQSVAIGASLNPELEQLGTMMINAEKNVQPLIDGFVRWAQVNQGELKAGLIAVGKILSDIASGVLPAMFKAVENTVLALAKFAKWCSDNEGTIKTVFQVLIAGAAVNAMKSLAVSITTETIPALFAFGTALGGQVMNSLRVFILAVSIDAPAALLALTTSAAIANAALSVGFVGLVAGIVWVANNWSTSCNFMSDSFSTFVVNIRKMFPRSCTRYFTHG